jgi:hypothetical protein
VKLKLEVQGPRTQALPRADPEFLPPRRGGAHVLQVKRPGPQPDPDPQSEELVLRPEVSTLTVVNVRSTRSELHFSQVTRAPSE